MPKDGNSLYAARLNSFKVGSAQYWPGKNRITTVDLLERAAAGSLAAGGRDAIVTLGGDGAVLATADGEPRHQPALPVQIQSSHGAGDAFTGALAARLALGADLPNALGYAQAAAALHVSSTPAGRESITPRMVLERLGEG